MDKPEVIVTYIKALVWPVLVMFILVSFHAEVASLLGGEVEVEIFGVKLKGKKISGLEQLEQQANQLKDALSAASDKLNEQAAANQALIVENTALRKAIDTQAPGGGTVSETGGGSKTGSVLLPKQEAKVLTEKSLNLTSEIQAEIDRAQSIVRGKNLDRARELESQGFADLVAGRYADAFQSFNAAYEAYPEYHNVDEIRVLIRRRLKGLEDPSTRDAALKEVFGKIIQEYSWGLPASAEQEMRRYLEG